MKILYVVHQFFPKHYTGTERFVLNVSKQMQKMGHEVKVLTYAIIENDGFKKQGFYMVKEYEYQGVPVISIRHEAIPEMVSFSVNDNTMEPLLERILSAEKFDVVHVAHPMRLGSIVKVAKEKNIPVVLTLTDFWLMCPRGIAVLPNSELCSSPEMGTKCIKKCFGDLWNDRIIQRFNDSKEIFNKVDICVSPTLFLAGVIKDAFDKDITVIRHGIDYCDIVPVKWPKNGKKEIVFGYIGTILPHKGVHLIIQAVKMIKNGNVKVKIYGNYFGEADYYEGLKKIADGDPRIEFLGEYKDEEMPAIMDGVDCMIAPSTWWENSPLTVLTSFAYRVPVITINVGGAAELVKNDLNGFNFEIGNSKDLMEKMKKIADSPDTLIRLKDNIVRPPRNEEEAFEYEKIYLKLVSSLHGKIVSREKNIVNINKREEPLSQYKKKYGDDFTYDIDVRDEMYLFLANHPTIKNPVEEYYHSGETMLTCLDTILSDNHLKYEDINSFLDFASGYGRFTRFLIQKIDHEKITVSDIDACAVDFCMDTYNVNGFYSIADPENLVNGDKYDIIWVASLFSHLSRNLWGKWLVRLYNMLSYNGILIFSTHGMFCYNAMGDEAKRSIKLLSDGFYFWPQSETKRLSTEDYGSTFVSYDYVKNFVTNNKLGKITSYYDHILWGNQDIYVIKNQDR